MPLRQWPQMEKVSRFGSGELAMGTWGTGPFDNDDAADMIAGLARKVHRVVERNDSDDYGEARAAAAVIVVAHGTDILGGIGLDVVLKALVKMRENSEWLAGYRRPQQIAEALDKELGAVLAKMRACKGCRKGLADDRKWLETLARNARRSPVPKSTFGTSPSRRRKARAILTKMRRLRRRRRTKGVGRSSS